MAISTDEVQFYLSCPSANAGYTGAGIPGSSNGKYMSVTQISAQPLDDLFLDLTPQQNAAGQVDYQCLFIMNNTSTGYTMKNPYVWMPSIVYTVGGANMEVGFDPIGSVPYQQTTVQAAFITSPTTPPPVTTYTGPTPNQNPGGVLVPDIPPQYCVALWFQRTATNSSQVLPQSFSLQVTFTSDN